MVMTVRLQCPMMILVEERRLSLGSARSALSLALFTKKVVIPVRLAHIRSVAEVQEYEVFLIFNDNCR